MRLTIMLEWMTGSRSCLHLDAHGPAPLSTDVDRTHMRMNTPDNSAIAMAWYRPDQWALLRAVSADAESLEHTYEEWLAFVSEQLRQLEVRGVQIVKIDVEVGALVRWCKSQGWAVDGRARAEYARQGLGREL